MEDSEQPKHPKKEENWKHHTSLFQLYYKPLIITSAWCQTHRPMELNRELRNEVKVKIAQSCLTLCDRMDFTIHAILQARILEWVAFPFSRGSPQPGIKPGCPTLQADSLPAEPQEKPKNTGVGSLSLLQQIFPTH